jgi:hypothetical protein
MVYILGRAGPTRLPDRLYGPGDLLEPISSLQIPDLVFAV